MSRRLRKAMRTLPPRRASVELPDDTEKLMFTSVQDSKDIEADPARSHFHSHPKLSPASQPVPHRDYSEHEITNVAAPIPDTGLPPPSVDTTTLGSPPVVASETSVSLKASQSRLHTPSKSTFVPLPSLKTLNLTEIEDAVAHSSAIHPLPTARPVVTATAGSGSYNPSPQSSTSRLSTTAIIALAVSGSLTLFIMVVLVKLIKRPSRRRTPTPSLPILHDGTFPDDKVESEGSPIFGGKERPSPTLQARSATGNAGPWTWTQYHSGIPKPAPTVTVTRSSSQDQLLIVNQTTQPSGPGVVETRNGATSAHGQNQRQYPFVGYGNLSAIKTKSPIPLQPVQNAITRAVSRLSTVSMSLYPGSPGGYSQLGGDVGVAIDGVTPSEPDNIVALRYKERVIGSRNRTSMTVLAGGKDVTAFRRSQSFAYGGMEPTSSPTAPLNGGQLNGGRARIKSTYYTPGSYPRASAGATNCGKQAHGHEQDFRDERGECRRGRDLATALGLASPIPPSPQPTLYPDDSMSVIGEAKKVSLSGRSQKKPVPKASSQCDSPPSDAAALGSLMMVDYAASKSTASLVNIRPSEAGRAREGQGDGYTGKSTVKKRVEDKPPRVPSPPPMPSLAQMAMQHADPQGYADYHSPTYSIYGLYDGDRKLSCGY